MWGGKKQRGINKTAVESNGRGEFKFKSSTSGKMLKSQRERDLSEKTALNFAVSKVN